MKNINYAATVPSRASLVNHSGGEYCHVDGQILCAMGGTEEAKQNNLLAINLMVQNIDPVKNLTVREIAQQCDLLTRTMANLEHVRNDAVVTVRGSEYMIDVIARKAYNELGNDVLDLNQVYPSLMDVDVPAKDLVAMIEVELNKLDFDPICVPHLHYQNILEEVGINITQTQRLGVFGTIDALKALGMGASWFSIEGVKQHFPICYSGEGDLAAFNKVVQDCLDGHQNYMDVLITACNLREQGIDWDETLTIDGKELILDWELREVWDDQAGAKVADLEEFQGCELSHEAIKAILTDKVKRALEEDMAEELEMLEDEDEWDELRF